MHRPAYAVGRAMIRYIGALSIRHAVVHGRRLQRTGPFVIACTHIGHLEPALLTGMLRRPVHWVARIEFYRQPWAAMLLRLAGTIPVDRQGVPVRMVRHAIARLTDGGIVGIFPEGGRTHGAGQAIFGGPVKGGACLIAMRANVPIVPVVVLGVEQLHAVGPWLPGQRPTVRTIVGRPIEPGPAASRTTHRMRRRAMTATLARAFVDLHHELTACPGGRR